MEPKLCAVASSQAASSQAQHYTLLSGSLPESVGNLTRLENMELQGGASKHTRGVGLTFARAVDEGDGSGGGRRGLD